MHALHQAVAQARARRDGARARASVTITSRNDATSAASAGEPGSACSTAAVSSSEVAPSAYPAASSKSSSLV
ncbi:hypothetical protein [Gemmatirosa kalamazoonensis]|uniref:hypothetical protein n=1 Tax=Gemmatirosa kalamazoonensis TaxID=861299 RepID=UPI00046D05AC|nr:hypothetical protein [Gemmatirosa kalamazoonensis]